MNANGMCVTLSQVTCWVFTVGAPRMGNTPKNHAQGYCLQAKVLLDKGHLQNTVMTKMVTNSTAQRYIGSSQSLTIGALGQGQNEESNH